MIVATRHELIMSLVAGLNPIMKVWKRTQLNNEDLCQMVLMTSKTSLQKWSGVFLFPSVSSAFFQIGTVTYQQRLRFRRHGFMYEFLPLIRKARTCCKSTVGMIDSSALVQFHFIALRRYFVNTKNGVEKSSSTPFSIDPIMIKICAVMASIFFLFWTVHRDFTQILRTKRHFS
ncbi:hypothetical protein PSR59_03210 [Ligilactobacillus ruminis]|uniref:Uncharacterized protein n=1 Tax=Ligilactobacillus ruminis TaxID=1623 RepID=A0AAQ2XMS4_9LACO|nr:hypothetical protein [Ligilactobacillus ruminis]WDC82648.1 hypothetical protein PSR59_03210 [Ligilactobacillus ruminis]